MNNILNLHLKIIALKMRQFIVLRRPHSLTRMQFMFHSHTVALVPWVTRTSPRHDQVVTAPGSLPKNGPVGSQGDLEQLADWWRVLAVLAGICHCCRLGEKEMVSPCVFNVCLHLLESLCIWGDCVHYELEGRSSAG